MTERQIETIFFRGATLYVISGHGYATIEEAEASRDRLAAFDAEQDRLERA